MTSLLIPLLVLAAVVTLVTLVVTYLPGGRSAGTPKASTRVFLILLRLAIGWHFLFEAADKFTVASWSSEPYLRESAGPLAPIFRDLAGDSVADRLTVSKDSSGKATLPSALAREWDNYFADIQGRYDFSEDQLKRARIAFDQAKSHMVTWLTVEKTWVKLPSLQPPPLEVEMTIPERLEQYQKKLDEFRNLEVKQPLSLAQAEQGKLRQAKIEANKWRDGLRKDLQKQTDDMVRNVLVARWWEPALLQGSWAVAVAGQPLSGPWEVVVRGNASETALVPITTQGQQPVPKPGPGQPWQWTLLNWSDFLVKWGLLLVGAGLLLGLLTRTACVAGALFLLSFFLAMPPLPGLPTPPRAEGHYLYLNKNIIELLALLTLATTWSGRWFGLDALVQFFNPKRWRTPAPVGPATAPRLPMIHTEVPSPVVHVNREPAPVAAPGPDAGHVSASSTSTEIPHGS